MENKEINKEYNEIMIDFRKKAFLLKFEKNISDDAIEKICDEFQSNFNNKFKSRYLPGWIYMEDFITANGTPDMRTVSLKKVNLPELFWYSKEGVDAFNLFLNKNLESLKNIGNKHTLGEVAGLIVNEYLCNNLLSEDVRKEALEKIIKELKNHELISSHDISSHEVKIKIFENIKTLSLPAFAEKITGRKFFGTFDKEEQNQKIKP